MKMWCCVSKGKKTKIFLRVRWLMSEWSFCNCDRAPRGILKDGLKTDYSKSLLELKAIRQKRISPRSRCEVVEEIAFFFTSKNVAKPRATNKIPRSFELSFQQPTTTTSNTKSQSTTTRATINLRTVLIVYLIKRGLPFSTILVETRSFIQRRKFTTSEKTKVQVDIFKTWILGATIYY